MLIGKPLCIVYNWVKIVQFELSRILINNLIVIKSVRNSFLTKYFFSENLVVLALINTNLGIKKKTTQAYNFWIVSSHIRWLRTFKGFELYERLENN